MFDVNANKANQEYNLCPNDNLLVNKGMIYLQNTEKMCIERPVSPTKRVDTVVLEI